MNINYDVHPKFDFLSNRTFFICGKIFWTFPYENNKYMSDYFSFIFIKILIFRIDHGVSYFFIEYRKCRHFERALEWLSAVRVCASLSSESKCSLFYFFFFRYLITLTILDLASLFFFTIIFLGYIIAWVFFFTYLFLFYFTDRYFLTIIFALRNFP